MNEHGAPGWIHCSNLMTRYYGEVMMRRILIPGGLGVFLILRPLGRPVVTVRQVHDHLPLTIGVLTSLGSPVENIRGTDVTSVRLVFC